MGFCKHCHRYKTKAVLSRHEKKCIPSKVDMDHFFASKSGKHAEDCSCVTCKNKRAAKKL